MTSNSDAAAATDGDDDNAFGADAAGDGLSVLGQRGRQVEGFLLSMSYLDLL